MLRYRRLANSFAEEAFIGQYISCIPGIMVDKFGNYILPPEGHDSKVMISTHTDSVSRVGGSQLVTADNGLVRLAKEERMSNCLGADDCAGIYVALRMIEAGVRNVTYVFHREEEAMGRGSNYLSNTEEAWLTHFNVCLALDRRGTSDIITSQLGEECASLEFADSLSAQLGINHKPAIGSFTDSANYTHLIPECSNLSVGYYNEHSEYEVLDLNYLELISQRLVSVDWDSLVVKRIPQQSMFSQFSQFGNVFM